MALSNMTYCTVLLPAADACVLHGKAVQDEMRDCAAGEQEVSATLLVG